MSTLPQTKPLNRKLQTLLTEDAYLRIKVTAAKKQIPVGRLISEWAEKVLPAVEVAA